MSDLTLSSALVLVAFCGVVCILLAIVIVIYCMKR